MRPYALVRSKRKTIAIHITENASVEVRAPLRAPVSAIDAFVKSKETWIAARLDEQRERLDERAGFELRFGDELPLCGRMLPIRESGGEYADSGGECFLVPRGMTPEQIRQAVVTAYKQTAKSILREKTAYFSEILGVTPSGVRITSAKTRWGSCSGKNSISFSWRLVMADEAVIDYVVVHELAHIREYNHSARFWKLVESLIPDYKQLKKRLRELSERLSREAWD